VTVVKDAVAEWKRQRREVFVPLTYRPGDLAEVDFFEVLVDVDGTRRKAWLFLMRLMYSGRDFAWIYERQDQISFLDGHVRAFTHFDGVRLVSPTTISGRPSSGSSSAARAR
jgi:transposase